MRESPQRGLLCAVLIAGGLWFGAWSAPNKLIVAYASQGWPTTVGTITSVRRTEDGSKHSGRRHHAHFRYRYEIDGRAYVGDRYDARGEARAYDRAEIDAIMAANPEGAEVTVYYDPENPQRSVIAQTNTGMIWIEMAFALAILGGGIYLWIRGRGAPRP